MKKIILYYLYTILLIPILERAIFGSLDKVSFHPGIVIHVLILFLLIIDFFKNKIKKNKLFFMILGFTLVYVVNLFIVEMIQFSNMPINLAISYALKIYLLLFLSYYIYKNAQYYLKYLDKILLINTIVILINIIAGYTFHLGWQSYHIAGLENSYRGFLAGNDTSIFAFTSFGYVLFSYSKAKIKIKKIFFLFLMILSIYSMYIIATKAMFLAIIITFLFTIRNGLKLKTIIFGGIFLGIFSFSVLSIPVLQERVFKNYMIQKKKTEEKLDTNVIPESLRWLNEIAPGRTVIGLSLVFKIASGNPLNLFFGYGTSGIYEAFGRPPQMHLFSPLGHYGLLGWLVFYLPQLLTAILVIKKRKITLVTTLFFAIFLYGTLGGFVYGNAATSVIYALLFSLTLYELKLKKGFQK